MNRNEEYLGHASIVPEHATIAGEMGTWVITYVVGKYGFDDAGTLRFNWRAISDWGTPQFDRPQDTGYTTVWTNGDATITASLDVYQRPFGTSILLGLSEGFLREGDIIRITMGDTSMGSPGMRAQSYCESEHEIKVFVDCFGTQVMEELPESVKLSIVAAQPHQVEAVVRPSVIIGKEFGFLVRALDEFGNACTIYEGEVELTIPELSTDEYSMQQTIIFTEQDKGSKRVNGVIVQKKGPFHIRTTDKTHRFSAISNGALADEEKEFKLFWGDMHGQTNFTVGTGSMDEYYSFARDIGGVDFTGWQGNDFEIDDDKWLSVREKTKEYNDPDNFVVFLGYEWSGITPRGGDHNVFFLDDNEYFYPSCNCLDRKNRTDIKFNAPLISDLYEMLEGRKDVITIPHVGGRHGNLDFFNPDFTDVIEIHSHHGTFEWFAMEAMKRRMKVGFVAASDDHTCRPGLSYPLGDSSDTLASFDVGSGYAGVYAKELTREGIWEAIRSRRCFASDSGRILLDVRVDGHMMGEEISCNIAPEIKVIVVGSAPVDNIQIYNWEEMIHSENMMKKSNSRIRICWSGVRARTRKKSALWDGQVQLKDGRILSAEEYAFDRLDQGIKFKSAQRVSWTSSTSGDYDGIILDVEAGETANLQFCSKLVSFNVDVKDIAEKPLVVEAGGENLKVEISLANEEFASADEFLKNCAKEVTFRASRISKGLNAYWVRVRLNDGHMAWSSPVFVNYDK